VNRRQRLVHVASVAAVCVVLVGCAGSREPLAAGPKDAPVQEPAPRLTVSGVLLADPAIVTIAGEGLASGTYQLAQCRPPRPDAPLDGLKDCDLTLPAKVLVAVDDEGALTQQMQARAVIAVGQRDEVDCVDATCVIGLVDASDEVVAHAALHWSDQAEVTPAPTLEVMPAPHPSRRDAVTVRGSGFPSGADVGLVQCPGATTEARRFVRAGACVYDNLVTARADGHGRIRVELRVVEKFQLPDGTLVDCRKRSADCVIATPWPKDATTRMAITRLWPWPAS